ncbi:MAG TPA: metallophosphoesterase, partial [Luteolibacter sp.]
MIRIFSDLHYRDSESRLQSLDTFLPLLAGADQVVLNGDTLDTQPPAPADHLVEVRAFFARHAGPVTFLTGNHDPDVSDRAELSLADGRVWITHGDVLFDDIAPWSSQRAEMARRIATLSRDLSADEHGRIETRLRLNRVACLNLPERHLRSHRALATRVARLTHTLFPPHRLLAMMRAWLATPALARRLAGEQRPRARLVVLGHTHHPGVWKDR